MGLSLFIKVFWMDDPAHHEQISLWPEPNQCNKRGRKNETSKLLLEPLRALKCCFHSILTKINVYFYSSECREVANGFGIKDNILIQRPLVAHKPCFWFSVWAHCKATPLVPPYHWLIKSKMMTRSALMPLCRQSCSLWTKSKPVCCWIESGPAVGRLQAEWLTCGSSFQTKPGESRVHPLFCLDSLQKRRTSPHLWRRRSWTAEGSPAEPLQEPLWYYSVNLRGNLTFLSQLKRECLSLRSHPPRCKLLNTRVGAFRKKRFLCCNPRKNQLFNLIKASCQRCSAGVSNSCKKWPACMLMLVHKQPFLKIVWLSTKKESLFTCYCYFGRTNPVTTGLLWFSYKMPNLNHFMSTFFVILHHCTKHWCRVMLRTHWGCDARVQPVKLLVDVFTLDFCNPMQTHVLQLEVA